MELKRELLISKGWIQAVAIVGLCGFLLLGILAYRIYTDEPLIPSKVIGANGQLPFNICAHLARAVVALVAVYLFSCRRYFSGSDDCRQIAETSAVTFLRTDGRRLGALLSALHHSRGCLERSGGKAG
jgi:hypothetical protein